MSITPPAKPITPAPPPLADKEMMKAVVLDGFIIPTAAIPQLGRQPLKVGFPSVSFCRGNNINSDPDGQLNDNFGDQQGTDFYATRQRKLEGQDFSVECGTGPGWVMLSNKSKRPIGSPYDMSRLVMGQIPQSNLHNQG
ncbi:unnamed protein product [Linum trigynum]|uniref:Uncharacterized protein n=1 Tax=Linum trigynum TaxID=586398 RepID=A0AAV2F181_9ROSI